VVVRTPWTPPDWGRRPRRPLGRVASARASQCRPGAGPGRPARTTRPPHEGAACWKL